MTLRNELAFFTVILLFSLSISIISIMVDSLNPWNLAVRLFALNGFIALSIAAILTAFLKEITLFLKKPFLRVHHYFAAAGLVLITLHPITLAIQTSNLSVFIPNFETLYLFLFYGGRFALVIIYISFAVVLLRRKIIAYWRPIHAFMYLALLIGIIHANLSGTDFLNNIIVAISINGLFAVTIISFSLKRIQSYRIRKRTKTRNAIASNKPV